MTPRVTEVTIWPNGVLSDIDAGTKSAMNVRKLIDKRIRRSVGGSNIAADIHGAIAANVGEKGGSTHVSSHQSQTVVQRDGHTEVRSETKEERS